MRTTARAKVNLRLRVLGRESSGYHHLETIFCALELADDLDIAAGPAGIRLEVDGPDTGPVHQNLVVRAAEAFFAEAGIAPAVEIRLGKRIPARAGLGGGSSDAAATLLALNQLHGTPLLHERLATLAAALGSDVPFFLSGAPLALAWGRGERLLTLPALPPAPALLAVPDFGVSTSEAYAALDRARAGRSAALPAPEPAVVALDRLETWSAVAGLAANDFEPIVFARHPELRQVKTRLVDAGAGPALLAGSGAAVFGIFEDAARRDAAAEALADAFGQFRIIRTATVSPGRPDLLG